MSNKKITLFLVSLASLSIGYFAAKKWSNKSPITACKIENPSMAITAIDCVLEEQLVGWNNGSLESFMDGYWKDDSLRFITRRGINMGWANVLSSYQKSYDTKEKMGHLSFEIFEKRFLDSCQKTATYVGMYRVDKTENNVAKRDSGMFSLIFKKFEPQGWKIIVDHTF